jgi:hypothetical protein
MRDRILGVSWICWANWEFFVNRKGVIVVYLTGVCGFHGTNEATFF